MMRCIHSAALSLLLCVGCATYMGLERGSTQPLAEPENIPSVPDRSEEFFDYSIFAVASDPKSFAEDMRATDMGKMGVPANVGTVPLRKIATRGIEAIVENHFRRPRADERPAFMLETIPQFLSVRQDGKLARVKISVMVRCIKQDASRRRLLSEIYTAETTGPWVEGRVPTALYEALNAIWDSFLRDFRQRVRPSTLLDGSEPLGPVPHLKFFFAPKRGDSAVATGTCHAACNGWEPGQAGEWAKKRIFLHCVKRLGADKDRVCIRYTLEKYDSTAQAWQFEFSAWEGTDTVR